MVHVFQKIVCYDLLNFREIRDSLVVANISCCEPDLVFDSYHKMGLDKAWSRKLVITNQFIFSKSGKKVAANKSWITVHCLVSFSCPLNVNAKKVSDEYNLYEGSCTILYQ